MDSAGNLYGTTACGGAYDEGTVFKIGPLGEESFVFSFGESGGDGCLPVTAVPNGANPTGYVLVDSTGSLYGTTFNGGTTGGGTVYRISPAGAISILYSFDFLTGSTDGDLPVGGLVMDRAGNLYGTTEGGTGADFYGTVFKIN
jgi:uncharacterized repeat protein (TIGR03803 family)